MPSGRRNQLTDQQLLTLALSVIIPVSVMIYSNSRITDAKETLRAEIKALGTELNAKIDLLQKDIKALGDRMETLLRIHELEHHK